MGFQQLRSGLLVPEFSPLQIGGLRGWWDASRITPVTDGTTVATWQDVSGYGVDLTEGTDGSRPTYQANVIGGRPVLRFTGGTKRLGSTAAGLTTAFSGSDKPLTLIAVIKKITNDTDDTVVGLVAAADTGTVAVHRFGTGSAPAYNSFRRDDASSAVTLTSGIPDTSPHVHAWVFSGTALTFVLDGVASAAQAMDVGTAAFGIFRVGAHIGSAQPYDGDIAELLLYNREVSVAELQRLDHQYFKRKYSIAVS